MEGSEHMSQDVTELLTLLQSKKKKQQCEKAKKTEMQYDRILKESLKNVEKIIDSGNNALKTKSNEYLTSAVESLKYQLTQFRMMKEYLDTSLSHYGAFNEAFEQNMNVFLKEQRNFEAEVGNDVSALKLDTSQFLKKVQKETNGVKEKLRTMGEVCV
ncbi:hypothetical protein BKA69DRAFT_1090660 [Paraphysoderma sedebokerense]|nr:hypothetical protein BKA69DRAFT_1090660 [Paraphysoderma sedebokerense]